MQLLQLCMSYNEFMRFVHGRRPEPLGSSPMRRGLPGHILFPDRNTERLRRAARFQTRFRPVNYFILTPPGRGSPRPRPSASNSALARPCGTASGWPSFGDGRGTGAGAALGDHSLRGGLLGAGAISRGSSSGLKIVTGAPCGRGRDGACCSRAMISFSISVGPSPRRSILASKAFKVSRRPSPVGAGAGADSISSGGFGFVRSPLTAALAASRRSSPARRVSFACASRASNRHLRAFDQSTFAAGASADLWRRRIERERCARHRRRLPRRRHRAPVFQVAEFRLRNNLIVRSDGPCDAQAWHARATASRHSRPTPVCCYREKFQIAQSI
jgi:hypothetical protein